MKHFVNITHNVTLSTAHDFYEKNLFGISYITLLINIFTFKLVAQCISIRYQTFGTNLSVSASSGGALKFGVDDLAGVFALGTYP